MLSIRTLPTIPPQGRIIFVGDIHGCVDEFNHLLHEARYNMATDVLVLVGDLVNKGYDSVGVVRRAMQLKAHCVLGNHDAALIARADHIRDGEIDPTQPPHKDDPMTATAAALPRDCYQFLTTLPHIIKVPQFDIIVTHAGLNPNLPLENQNLWELLHMRRVLPNGRVTDAQNGGDLWATKWKGPETVIFGHDARTGLQQHKYAIGLDSGCCYGGTLTAYIMPGKRFVKVPGSKKGVTKKPVNASPATAIGYSPSTESAAALSAAARKSPAGRNANFTPTTRTPGSVSPPPVQGSAQSLTEQIKSMLSVGKPPTPAAGTGSAGHSLLFPSAPSGTSTPAAQGASAPRPAQVNGANRSPPQAPSRPPTQPTAAAPRKVGDVGSSTDLLLRHIVGTAATMLESATASGQHQLGAFGLQLITAEAVDSEWEDLVSGDAVAPDVWARLVRGLVDYAATPTATEHSAAEALGRVVDVIEENPAAARLLDRQALSATLFKVTKAPKSAVRSALIALRE